MNAKAINKEAYEAAVTNAKRLAVDARLLFDNERYGSCLAVSILAFEEAGKGHQIELGLIKKSKMTPSWHQFRQSIAAAWMAASALQKHGIKLVISKRMQELIDESLAGSKTMSEWASKPPPDEYRQLADKEISSLKKFDDAEQLNVASDEIRWASSIVREAAEGKIETLRQSGIYVDLTEQGEIETDPADVTKEQASHWLTVAERSVLLLETGDFRAPYGR